MKKDKIVSRDRNSNFDGGNNSIIIIVSTYRVSMGFVSPSSFPKSTADDTNEFDAIHPIDLWRGRVHPISSKIPTPRASLQ